MATIGGSLVLATVIRNVSLIGAPAPSFAVTVISTEPTSAFAAALRARPIPGWNPRLVQFVSPQVWASRPGRARILEAHHDLVLSILPFEVEWYARHAPGVRVEFVGHPLVDRHARQPTPSRPGADAPPRITLLPGSRTGELRRHLPVILGAAAQIHRARPDTRFVLVAPDASTAASLSPQVDPGLPVEIRAGQTVDALLIERGVLKRALGGALSQARARGLGLDVQVVDRPWGEGADEAMLQVCVCVCVCVCPSFRFF